MRRDGRMSTNVQFLGKEVPVEVSDSISEYTDKKYVRKILFSLL